MRSVASPLAVLVALAAGVVFVFPGAAEAGATTSLAAAPPAATAVAGRRLDVIFVPDAAAAPPFVVMVEAAGARRAIAWSFAGGAGARGALADEGGTAGALLPLPGAPGGASLVERNGSLSITIDDAGSWEDVLKVVPPPAGVAPLPVSGPRGLRLVVDGGVGGPAAPAVLYGPHVRLTGRAVVRADRAPLRAVVVADGEVLEAPGTAVQEASGCGRLVPAAVSVVGSHSLQLFGSGPALCAGPLVVVPVTGRKLDARRDVAVSGLVVAR